MVLTFSGVIWYWRGPSPFYFVTVPDAEAAQLESVSGMVTYGWGMVPASVRIGETDFDTALWPKNDTYIVPLKAAVRRAEQLDEGDEIELSLTVRI